MEFGEIVMLQFPFTDLQSTKYRPAILIKETKDGDAVFARITSKPRAGEYEYKIKNWKKAGLLVPSVIRIHKITSLHTSLIVKSMGKLQPVDNKAFKKELIDFFKNI